MTDLASDGLTMLAISVCLSFVLTTGLGFPAIPLLRRLKAGQSIREDGPQSHLAKAGTPTMGGIFMVISIVITTIIVAGFSRETAVLLVGLVGFGLVGFIDDYIKVVLKRNLGLTEKQKMGLQIVMAVLLILIAQSGTEVAIPFADVMVDFGWIYYPFIIFVVVGVVNSVNLTDGLDGLASGVTVPVALFFMFTALGYQYGTTGVFAGALLGACLGFLIHNHKPAKVFMGDTGSLAIGGAISAIAIVTNTTLILPIVCLVYVMEALSVIIQVGVYKKTKKRVFKMAPLHHHFELSGWGEVKVVLVFSLISAVLCAIGAAIMW